MKKKGMKTAEVIARFIMNYILWFTVVTTFSYTGAYIEFLEYCDIMDLEYMFEGDIPAIFVLPLGIMALKKLIEK